MSRYLRPTLAALALSLSLIAPAHADWFVSGTNTNKVYASVQGSDCGFSTGTIPVADRPFGIAVHPDGSRFYTANLASGTVSVVDIRTRKVIATIPVGGSPFGLTRLAIHPDGARGYAVNNNRVEVFSTITNTVLTRIFGAAVGNGIAPSPDGSRIYVSTYGGFLTVIDTASNTILRHVALSATTLGVAVHPDGSRMYVGTADAAANSSIAVLDTTDFSILATIPVPPLSGFIALNPAGSRLFVPNNLNQNGIALPGSLTVIDTATNAIIATVPAGLTPSDVAADKHFVYVTNIGGGTGRGSVSVFDNMTGASLHLMDMGGVDPQGVATYVHPDVPAQPPGVRVTGIEVTQGIQDLNNSVQLVAERRTFVRVHVKSDTGATVPNVAATLFGVLHTCDIDSCFGTPLGSLLPVNSVTWSGLTKTVTRLPVKPDPVRANLNDGFIFELPWDWTHGRPLTLFVMLAANGAPPASSCNPDAPYVGAGFDVATTLKIRFIRAAYDSSPTTQVETPQSEQAQAESWLKRAFPVSKLIVGPDWRFYDAGLAARVNQTHADCQVLNKTATGGSDDRNQCADNYLSSHPSLQNAAANQDGAYVLIPQLLPETPGTFTRGSCCNGKIRLGAGPSSGSKYGYYTTHEIGHLLGRDHPEPFANVCGHDDKDKDYPYDFALIHPAFPYDPERGFAGYDSGDLRVTPRNPPVTRGSFNSNDVMSYCNPPNQWVSDYTYGAVYDRLRGIGGSGTGAGSGGGAAGPQLGDWLMVLGRILPDATTSVFMQSRRVDRIHTIPERTPGNHSIRLTGATGTVLAEYAFEPEILADSQSRSGGAPSRSFSHVVPFVAGARAIQIVDNSGTTARVIGSKAISAAAPVIGSVGFQGTPAPSASSITIQWSASDSDGDALTFDVFLTRDGGTTLQPLMLSLTGTSAEIDTSALGGIVQFRVVATDGVQSAFSDTPPFTLSAKPPRPRIQAPGNVVTIVAGQSVNFEGTATDPQDGTIADANLSWSVDNGTARPGARFSVGALPIGTHEVVLTATNSVGLSGTTSAMIVVEENVGLQGAALTGGPGQIGWHVAAGEVLEQTAQIAIGNVGTGTLNFTATSNAPWLTIGPATGSAPAAITATADPYGFADGTTKEAEITIAAIGDPDQVVKVPVSLSVGNTFVVGGIVTPDTPPPPTCAANVSAQTSMTRGGLRLNRANGRYVQQVTVRNTGATEIVGAVSLVLDGLSSNATLFNKTANTACATPAAPYINVNAGSDNVLSAGEGVTATLEFTNPNNQAITYNSRVLAGSDPR